MTGNLSTAEVSGFHAFKRAARTEDFPERFSSYVRSFGEAYYWPQGRFTVVTRAADAVKALTDPALSCDRSSFFMSRMPNLDLTLIKDFFAVVRGMMVMSDGADHKKKRAVAARGLTDELLLSYEDQIPGHIAHLVANSEHGGVIDFASDLAAKLPCMILADLFGIPDEDRALFYLRSNQMTAFFGGGTGYENEDGIRVNDAAAGLRSYFVGLLAARRREPRADFFSKMVQSADRLGMSDDDVIAQGIMMLVAGQVTTADQMCNIMMQLLLMPDLEAAVRADPNLVVPMVEELMRLDPAVTFIFRVAKAETVVGQVAIKPGDVVFISTHAVNRDGAVFPNPNKVDLSRGEPKHISFGFGAHHCLGARLARMEIKAVFSWLFKHSASLSLAGPAVRDHYSLSFSGFSSLPLRIGGLCLT